jgi:hypothetical protein
VLGNEVLPFACRWNAARLVEAVMRAFFSCSDMTELAGLQAPASSQKWQDPAVDCW